MKTRGIIVVDFDECAGFTEAGLQEAKLKEICAAIKLTTPSAIFAEALVRERRGEAGVDLKTAKFRTG
jgi:hypothetical protein